MKAHTGLLMPTLVTRRLSMEELVDARDAANYRTRMEQLCELVRDSTTFDLNQAPGPQLIVSIHRTFGTRAVAMFDAHFGRLDRIGNWSQAEEELAKDCYLHGAPTSDLGTGISQRVLRSGKKPIGALVTSGDLSPLIVDTLASLAVITMERHQACEAQCGFDKGRQNDSPSSVMEVKQSAEGSRRPPIRCGQIELDPEKRRVLKGGRRIHLTPKEFELLYCLMHDAGKPIPYEQLLRAVWGPDHGREVEYLRTFACQLRKKIEDDPANPKYLQVESYFGYRFNEPEMTA
jgi:DNA-binding winged helix-turn-helix (wHTH) protein